MLTQKKDRKKDLKPIHNSSAIIIKISQPAPKKAMPEKKSNHHRLPPLNQFNTGYLKGRDNDPL